MLHKELSFHFLGTLTFQRKISTDGESFINENIGSLYESMIIVFNYLFVIV